MAEPHLSSAEPRFGGSFGAPFCLRVSADGWPHGVRVFVAASYRVLNVPAYLAGSDRQGLDRVGKFGAAGVAAIRQSLDCLVRQYRALSFEHQARDDILGCDQFYAVLLPAELAAN
jgi:hypothetical protein